MDTRSLQRLMEQCFGRSGHPGAKGQPAWPAYTLEKRATMMIDAQCHVEDDPFGQERALWDSLTL